MTLVEQAKKEFDEYLADNPKLEQTKPNLGTLTEEQTMELLQFIQRTKVLQNQDTDVTQRDKGQEMDNEDISPEYKELLERIFTQLAKEKAAAERSRKIVIRPPEVGRMPRKTMFINFLTICKDLNRDHQHFLQFILTELGTTASIDGDNRLIIRGSFNSKNIESLMKKYIDGYVQCKLCHSLNTHLKRDPSTRLYTQTCNSCGAERNISRIDRGYEANLTKRSRRK